VDTGQAQSRDPQFPDTEEPYRFLAEALPQMVWIATTENRIVYINAHWREYTGLTLEETQAGGWAGMIHPDDFAHAVGQAASAIAGDGMYKAEYRLRRASDGEWRWHTARARIVRTPDGVAWWLGTAMDIEDRKRIEDERKLALDRELALHLQAEVALAEQRKVEQQLLLLVEASGALIASIEPELVLKTILELARLFVGADAYAVWRRHEQTSVWNVVARDGLSEGYSDSVTGSPSLPHAPLPVEDVFQEPMLKHRLDSYRREGIRSMLTVPLVIRGRTEGTITFYYRSPHRFNEIETRVAGGLANLAAAALGTAELYQRQDSLYRESQTAQEALRRSVDDLRRVNEDLNQFAWSASHDLQEPLRMVAIYSQILAEEYADRLDENGKQYIRYSVQGARQMEKMIRDILAYATTATVIEPPDGVTRLADALDKTLVNLDAAIIEASAVIEAEVLPELMVHEVHLVQLLQNLIGNAIKYRRVETPLIRIAAEPLPEKPGEFWKISVQDNGIGIDADYRDQVFSIFKRLHTSTEYPGTGVGLAICQKIVQRYGGSIWVDSEAGKGSAFVFTLPGLASGREAGA
jgi:PAS domain S-box-containing protein